MSQHIILKLDVTKIIKEWLFKGQKGTYLDLVVYENDATDQFGNSYLAGITEYAPGGPLTNLLNGNLEFLSFNSSSTISGTARHAWISCACSSTDFTLPLRAALRRSAGRSDSSRPHAAP